MIQIIIQLIEFFLNPGLIPSQRDQMSQKLSLIFIKSMLENIKWCINVRRASCLLSKYYVINYFQSKKNMISLKQENMKNTSLAAPGALAHRLQCRTACNTSPPAEPKMADEVQKPSIIGPSDQLSLNKFFDFIIPSMRTSKIQNGRQGAPKWPTGSGKGSNPRLLAILSNFR